MAGSGLRCLPCEDSDGWAEWVRGVLDIDQVTARHLGCSALAAIERGEYLSPSGRIVDWSARIDRSRALTRSIAPDDPLDRPARVGHEVTEVQVRNTTTLEAARALISRGMRPLALNFANGIEPGGGFLDGARAQEETLCRSSALHATLEGDAMYEFHLARPEPDSSDWMILSPEVPVFRDDSGTELDEPWLLDVITSAAPIADLIGRERSAGLLERRIHRLLEVAVAFSYDTLVLGAWGCGAFGNDPYRTATDFRRALESEFQGCFARIDFAISDWSADRWFLGPFRDVFSDRSS